jgi:ribosome-associated protein
LKKKKSAIEPLTLARLAAELALTKKAEDVEILDLGKVSAAADFFVLASAASDVQVKAIADAIVDGLEKDTIPVWHVEGYANRRWILIDLVDVVVHVLHKEAREFYALERLWGDAPRTRVE